MTKKLWLIGLAMLIAFAADLCPVPVFSDVKIITFMLKIFTPQSHYNIQTHKRKINYKISFFTIDKVFFF